MANKQLIFQLPSPELSGKEYKEKSTILNRIPKPRTMLQPLLLLTRLLLHINLRQIKSPEFILFDVSLPITKITTTYLPPDFQLFSFSDQRYQYDEIIILKYDIRLVNIPLYCWTVLVFGCAIDGVWRLWGS